MDVLSEAWTVPWSGREEKLAQKLVLDSIQ